MFEVGKKYRFKVGLPDDVWQSVETVLEIDGSLLRLEGASGEIRIVNTASPSFHIAEPLSDKPRAPFGVQINLGNDDQ
jgi:hypothetical protein